MADLFVDGGGAQVQQLLPLEHVGIVEQVAPAHHRPSGLSQNILEEANNLTVRAPFAGKLIDVKEFQIDENVTEGTKVATLVLARTSRAS